LGLDYMRLSFGDEWWNPRAPHDTVEAVESNRELVREFLSDLSLRPDEGHSERSDIMTHDLDDHVELKAAFEKFLTQYRVTLLEDSQKFTAILILIQNHLEKNPNAICSVYHMSKGKLRTRTLDADGGIENLFQGAHPDTRGSIYPGDRKIKRQEGLTIQLHRLIVQDEEGRIEAVPTLAIWIPREIAVDLVIQDQPS
ncbi:MAG TPA: hypothetical protein VJ044_11970, partial [Candidatus Hodarchaeales archaeon]|nr:hypothetical protein [Candidatus Hodarchaeales archaeon]